MRECAALALVAALVGGLSLQYDYRPWECSPDRIETKCSGDPTPARCALFEQQRCAISQEKLGRDLNALGRGFTSTRDALQREFTSTRQSMERCFAHAVSMMTVSVANMSLAFTSTRDALQREFTSTRQSMERCFAHAISMMTVSVANMSLAFTVAAVVALILTVFATVVALTAGLPYMTTFVRRFVGPSCERGGRNGGRNGGCSGGDAAKLTLEPNKSGEAVESGKAEGAWRGLTEEQAAEIIASQALRKKFAEAHLGSGFAQIGKLDGVKVCTGKGNKGYKYLRNLTAKQLLDAMKAFYEN